MESVSGRNLQYRELARYYDFIYRDKDYRKESAVIARLIRKYKYVSVNTLLDVGCGTAKHLQHLHRSFACTGVDLSRDMLKIARARVPSARFVRGDMAAFRLKRKFGALISMFSAVGYAGDYRKLDATIANFARHLYPGGVMIIEPWPSRSTWKPGTVHMKTFESPTVKISRIGYSGRRGNTSLLEEHYTIAEQGKGVSVFTDRQEMGLFERRKFRQILAENGFKVKPVHIEFYDGRELFVATKS